MTTIFFYVLLFQIKDWDKICEEEGKMTSPIICYIRGYLIHNLDAYTFHIAVFAIEAEGKETYFPETR